MKKIPEINFNRVKEKHISGFELIELEALLLRLHEAKDHNPFHPHRLGFFAILIITAGEVHHTIDFETHRMFAGDVIVMSKGQIHAFDDANEYKGFLLLFTEAFMQKYMAQSTITQINHLYNYFLNQQIIHNPDRNQTLLNVLRKELESTPSSLPNIVGALLAIYLLKLNNESMVSQASTDNRKMEYFNHFKNLVESNFTKTRDAKFYAAELSVSYKHLNEICKTIAKITAKSFIDSYVVLEAKRMLVTTTLSVKEIAFELGFDEPTNFIKYFKKQSDRTPLEFRNFLV